MLSCENICKSFASDEKKHVVADNVSLHVEKGEFLSILGQSGCGKSTLLRILGGFIKADSGVVTLDNTPVNKPTKDILMVFQSFDQLFPWKTIRANIVYALRKKDKTISKDKAHETASYWIEKMQLDGFADSYPFALSGGMKQRAALARAFALKPKVLLMDEPFSSLDCFTREEAQKTLASLWQEIGVTIIFVTHDIGEAVRLSTRIALYSKTNKGISEIVEVTGDREQLEMELRSKLEGSYI